MILVHICCSVDSHYFLQKLRAKYPDSQLVGYFYNPNIHPRSEYSLRFNDVKRSCEMLNIELFEGEYELEDWLQGVQGLEDEPEKGERCVKCFDIRLIKTAIFAKQKNIRIFTTTLLSSPMKEQQILYTQGDKIAQEYGLEFIKIDVRSNGGTQEQAQLAREDNLYRQGYCGCEFALLKQRAKNQKISLELLENISQQFLPASNEDRMRTFEKRDICERESTSYVLAKRPIIAWRNLRSVAFSNGTPLDIYVLADSKSKNNVKTSKIVWIESSVSSPLALNQILRHTTLNAPKKVINLETHLIHLGIASKDDSVFISLQDFNTLCGSAYKNVKELLVNPIAYEMENILRVSLCGFSSINPIIVLDERIESNLRLHIHTIFQEEGVFRVIVGNANPQPHSQDFSQQESVFS